MNRPLAIILIFLVSIGLALAGFGIWCLGTTSGTHWLIGAAGKFLGVEIRSAELEGSLLGELTFKDFRVSWEGGEVRADTISLAIQPFRFWSGILPIEELAIDRLILQLSESTGDMSQATSGEKASTAPFANIPEWLKVSVDRLRITSFVYRSAASPTEEVPIANLIAGQYQLAGHRLVAKSFAYHSPYVELDGEFDWELTNPHLVMTAKVRLPETNVDPALFETIKVPTEFPGHIELDGDWNGYAGPVQFGVINETGSRTWFSALATGSWRGIRFTDLKGGYLGGAINGDLELSWIDSCRMEGQLSGKALDLSGLIGGATGQATFDANGMLLVPYDDQPMQASLSISLHEGQFQEHALHGHATGNWSGMTLVDLDVDLTGEGARLLAKGSPEKRVEFDLEVTELAAFHNELGGRVAAQGWLSWPDDILTGDIRGHGENIAWRDTSVRKIELKGRHMAGDEGIALALSGVDWKFGSFHMKRIVGDLSGTYAKHRLRLEATDSSSRVKLLIRGRYRPDNWTGQLMLLTGDDTPWGTWAMSQPTLLSWGEGGINISNLLLTGDGGTRLELDVKGWGSPKQADVSLTWAEFKLGWLQPVVAPFALEGRSNGEMHYGMSAGKPVAIAGRLAAQGRIKRDLFELSCDNLKLDFDWNEHGLQLSGTAQSDTGEFAQVRLASADPLRWQWPLANLAADITWEGLDLSRFNAFLNDSSLEGKSGGTLALILSAKRLSRVNAHLSAQGRILQGKTELGLNDLSADLDWDAEQFRCAVNVAGAQGGQAALRLTSQQAPSLAWPQSGTIALEFNDLGLVALTPLLPHGIEVAGFLDGHAVGVWKKDGTIDLSGKLQVVRSHVGWSSEEGQIRLPVEDAFAEWNWSGDSFTGTFSINLAGHGDLKGAWKLPLRAGFPTAFDPAGKVQAIVAGQMQVTGLLSTIGPLLVQDIHCKTSINLVMQGLWANPELDGQINIRECGAYLPAIGSQLDNINIQGNFADNRLRIEHLEIHSGPGALNGTGELVFDHLNLIGYRVKLLGKNFQVLHLPELQVLCNPDLELSGNKEKLSLKGLVLIPVMKIRESKGVPEVQASKDVVLTTTASQSRKLPFATDILVTVKLGDDVTFKSGGVNTRLTGDVMVNMERTGELTARGAIQLIDGTFRAYGANLKIRQGVLNYKGGAITNPELLIFAAREVGSVLAGVQITGNAEAPVVTLYSRPTMPDRDILGYILMGRNIRAENQEADILMMGASSLLPGGIALDELGITEIDLQGLFSGAGGVRLSKMLTDKWQIESTLGIESGVDLYYIIEFE